MLYIYTIRFTTDVFTVFYRQPVKERLDSYKKKSDIRRKKLPESEYFHEFNHRLLKVQCDDRSAENR